jgi:F0F1-type ATP synthase membrane subunit a
MGLAKFTPRPITLSMRLATNLVAGMQKLFLNLLIKANIMLEEFV